MCGFDGDKRFLRGGSFLLCEKIDWDDCMERGVMVKIGGVFIGGISIVLCSVFLVSNWFGWVV